jgi:hypothetical protein
VSRDGVPDIAQAAKRSARSESATVVGASGVILFHISTDDFAGV